MNKIQLLTFFIGILFFSKGYSQVTIGSTEKPVEGALLHLKNLLEDPVTKVNANKGLLLPRVELESIDNLYPMFSDQDGNANSDYNELEKKEYQDNIHTGLLIYNTSRCVDNLKEGPVVWNGEKWINITETQGVYLLEDDRGIGHNETYLVGDFGKAGIWMLENLRAKKYAPRTQENEIIVKELPATPSLGNYEEQDNPYEVAWAYPALNDNNDINNQTIFDLSPRIGLLYTAAATNSKVPDPNINEGSISIPDIQGICPKGWHLPSDLEWTDLENEISMNTSLYSSITDIKELIVNSPNITTASVQQNERVENLGSAFISTCSYPNYQYKSNGSSNSPLQWRLQCFACRYG